ncbi:MAG: helix-turn-helix transcriptional regulator [Clostridia bacterium]|nr:helix-turn-helix transcriptional regulator [Clostridia bacterium]
MEKDFRDNRIKELREVSGITQRFLSLTTGIKQANLCRWEKGLNRPNVQDCWKLADYFGVSIDYLVGRTDNK